jgi:two-component system, chemotaxis family, sensor kinase CheA
MSDDAFFLEIQDGFLQEAADLLNRVEALSLSLEKNPESQETYAELARLAHNFKGSGKAVGFDHISKLGHALEDFILAIKNKIISATPEQLDFLFGCLDLLKNDIQVLTADKSTPLDYTKILSEISERLSHRAPALVEPASALENSSAFEESAPKVSTTLFSNKKESVTPAKQNQSEVLRIQKHKIDFMLEAFGEQVIMQSTLEQCKFDIEKNKELLTKTISQLSKLTFELQSHALALTMVQLGPTFTKLERAIRDAARACDKNIEVEMQGSETDVDKTLIDSLSDSLTHMVRNAVDHAIEPAADRIIAGKSEVGKVKVSAKRSGGQLWIEVSDDGKGLDPDKLKNKAIEKGLISRSTADAMPNQEAYRLIFKNGFSTKDQVSEVSGRGVGMNVVEEAVNMLKGNIEILSEIHKGTTFRLKLPLSLAIFNGAVVRVNLHKFIIPNSDISEIGRVDVRSATILSKGRKAIKLREEIFELVDLRGKFNFQLNKANENSLDKNFEVPIIISRKNRNIAYVVDEIIGMQKIVQKPLGEEIKSKPEFAAGTILSDGSPGVILNLNQLCEAA